MVTRKQLRKLHTAHERGLLCPRNSDDLSLISSWTDFQRRRWVLLTFTLLSAMLLVHASYLHSFWAVGLFALAFLWSATNLITQPTPDPIRDAQSRLLLLDLPEETPESHLSVVR